MDDLVLAKDVDLGKYEHKEYYAIAATQPAANDTNQGVWNLITQWNGETNPTTIIDWAKTLNIPEGQKLWRKSESNVIDGLLGYSNSYYTLTITSDFVQATDDAMKASWGFDHTGLADKNITNIQLGADNVSLVSTTSAETTVNE